jgi:hypothetical protein
MSLIRASCLVVALAIAGPALAQQGPTAASTKVNQTFFREGGAQAGYLKRCGARFVCYTGIPLNCTASTRPYQSIADHQCFCLRDGCPQN